MRSAVVVAAWRSAVVVLAITLSAMPALAQKGLVSVKTDQAPAIDGTAEAAWEKAPAYKITLDQTPYKPEGFKGLTKTNVTMKSMYDKDSIYVLLQWDDPTQSVERNPWVKQPDGTWKQLKALDQTGHDNTYYEDKLAILWNINARALTRRGATWRATRRAVARSRGSRTSPRAASSPTSRARPSTCGTGRASGPAPWARSTTSTSTTPRTRRRMPTGVGRATRGRAAATPTTSTRTRRAPPG
jgi:hypothetical protein